MNKPSPAFFIFDTKVTNSEALTPYLAKVEATYKAFGGEMLVLGGVQQVMEGQAPQGGVVMLRFNSMADAQTWYHSPEYQAIITHRQAGSQANAWLVEGLAGA